MKKLHQVGKRRISNPAAAVDSRAARSGQRQLAARVAHPALGWHRQKALGLQSSPYLTICALDDLSLRHLRGPGVRCLIAYGSG